MIDYTIEHALKSKLFDEIIINTDWKKFKFKNNNNCLSRYIRPQKLGNSKVRVLDVLKEMLFKININKNDNIFLLFPTCPLRNSIDIKNAFKIFIKRKSKHRVISVCKYEPSIDVALKVDKKGILKHKFLNLFNKSPGNNNHGINYYCNYGIIIDKCDGFLFSKKLIEENNLPYFMPFKRSIDVDEEYQFELLKKMLKKN